MTKKFAVTYEIDYTHRVMVGVAASDAEAARQRAVEAFDEGSLWDDTEAMPLLFDDYEEVAGETLRFSVEDVPAFPEADASVHALKQREFAFSACKSLLAGEIHGAHDFASKALPHFVGSARKWDDLMKLPGGEKIMNTTFDDNPNRMVIHVEGGLVQAVYTERHEPIRVAIMDFDIDSGDEVFRREDGIEFIGHAEETVPLPGIVAQVFAALGENALAGGNRGLALPE